MDLIFIKDRLLRIVKRPPELLYALTRHLFLILVLLGGATALFWFLAVSGNPLYEGRAHLVITQSDDIGPTLHNEEERKTDQERFLAAQSIVLKSDAVVRLALERLHDGEIPQGSGEMGGIKGAVFPVLKKILDSLQLTRPDPEDPDGELRIQKAVANFQDRMQANPDPRSNTVQLVIVGPEREQIVEELRSWIDAYRSRVSEISQQRFSDLLTNRLSAYRDIERRTRRELEAFRREHPNVSAAYAQQLTDRIARLTVLIDDFIRRRGQGGAEGALPAAGTPADQERQKNELLRRLEEEWQRLVVQGNVPATSRQAVGLRQRIEELTRQEAAAIAAQLAEEEKRMRQAAEEESTAEEVRNRKEDRVESGLDNLRSELAKLYTERAQIGQLLPELQRLQADHQRARDDLRTMESRVTVEIQEGPLVEVAGGPSVGARPITLHPAAKVAIGGVVGLLLGLLLSILVESLSNKIRFKHDVISDLGLPVTAVFPK